MDSVMVTCGMVVCGIGGLLARIVQSCTEDSSCHCDIKPGSTSMAIQGVLSPCEDAISRACNTACTISTIPCIAWLSGVPGKSLLLLTFRDSTSLGFLALCTPEPSS